MVKLSSEKKGILDRMASGWRPLKEQIDSKIAKSLEKQNLIRLDWGPEDTADNDKFCWYLTEAGKTVSVQIS